MKRLEFLLLTACIGTGFVTVGCGGTSTSDATPQAKAAATAPAGASVPAAQPAASTRPAATSEPSQAGASDAAAGGQEAPKDQERRFVPPVRGTADIEILAPKTKVEGDEVVTTIKIRNASRGAIAMLRVDETWYDKAGNAMPGDTQRYRKLFMPGEVIEMVLRTPKSPKFFQNTFQFTHANGKVEVKTVKSFPTAEPGK
jgi:hypothetical protein